MSMDDPDALSHHPASASTTLAIGIPTVGLPSLQLDLLSKPAGVTPRRRRPVVSGFVRRILCFLNLLDAHLCSELVNVRPTSHFRHESIEIRLILLPLFVVVLLSRTRRYHNSLDDPARPLDMKSRRVALQGVRNELRLLLSGLIVGQLCRDTIRSSRRGGRSKVIESSWGEPSFEAWQDTHLIEALMQTALAVQHLELVGAADGFKVEQDVRDRSSRCEPMQKGLKLVHVAWRLVVSEEAEAMRLTSTIELDDERSGSEHVFRQDVLCPFGERTISL
jgi:hypothetical protein